MHPYHLQAVQALIGNIDYLARIKFCKWIQANTLRNPNFIGQIVWTNEYQCTKDGITNYHNEHRWDEVNPHTIKQKSFQLRFNVNVWAGICGTLLIGISLMEI